MGIAERRATKEFQDKSLPALLTEIHKYAGFEVPVDISWDQLAKEGVSERFTENWKKVYFQPTIEALKSISRDEMGRDALKSGLKKIVFCNSSGRYSPESAISFTSGELTIDHDPDCNIDYIEDRTNHARKEMERSL
jgi:hypothetical protein